MLHLWHLFLFFQKQIDYCDKRLKSLDDRKVFYADDEIGWFFEKVKEIHEQRTKHEAKIDPGINEISSFLRTWVFAKMLFLA